MRCEIAVELRDGALAMRLIRRLGEQPPSTRIAYEKSWWPSRHRFAGRARRRSRTCHRRRQGPVIRILAPLRNPRAVAEAENDVAVEAAGAAQVDVLEVSASWWRSWAFLRRRCRALERRSSDFAVDQQARVRSSKVMSPRSCRAICSRKAACMPGRRNEAMRCANGWETGLSVI